MTRLTNNWGSPFLCINSHTYIDTYILKIPEQAYTNERTAFWFILTRKSSIYSDLCVQKQFLQTYVECSVNAVKKKQFIILLVAIF